MSNPNPIHVFIAEDHAIVRKGVRTLLSLEPDIEVVGEAVNGREAVEQVRSLRPDVILMDLVMPELDGGDIENIPFGLQMIHSANRCDHTLDSLWTLSVILHDLKVLMLTRFLDSCKHGASI